jgi:hypothetical protein
MTIAKSEDIRWIASGLDDFAVLLHVHGIDELADQLDAVRAALRSVSPESPLANGCPTSQIQRPH